jgi:cytochrome o ubiquinol oxidase subunit III
MSTLTTHHATAHHDDSKTILGFWIYLMTDCILFACLFATYAVLHNNTFGGPPLAKLIDMPFVLGETLILLTSSFTCGLAVLAANRKSKGALLALLGTTALLGLAFLGMEVTEFVHLASEGNGWDRSGFLSSFFTLVGTHGCHIAVGLLWAAFLVAQILRRGITSVVLKRLFCFSLFWHFLDVVWIFIFTFVYLMGAI